MEQQIRVGSQVRLKEQHKSFGGLYTKGSIGTVVAMDSQNCMVEFESGARIIIPINKLEVAQ